MTHRQQGMWIAIMGKATGLPCLHQTRKESRFVLVDLVTLTDKKYSLVEARLAISVAWLISSLVFNTLVFPCRVMRLFLQSRCTTGSAPYSRRRSLDRNRVGVRPNRS